MKATKNSQVFGIHPRREAVGPPPSWPTSAHPSGPLSLRRSLSPPGPQEASIPSPSVAAVSMPDEGRGVTFSMGHDVNDRQRSPIEAPSPEREGRPRSVGQTGSQQKERWR